MKDTKFRTLDPQRIAAIPNGTLEIVIEGQMTHWQAGHPRAPQNRSLQTLMFLLLQEQNQLIIHHRH